MLALILIKVHFVEMEKEEEKSNTMGIIIGCSVGGAVLFLFFLLILYKAVDYYMWQKWLVKHGLDDNPWEDEDKALQYPITDRYNAIKFK